MKYIRIFITLVIALSLALSMVVLSEAPVLAQARLYVSPDAGKIGRSVNVYGYNYTPGQSVYFYFSSNKANVSERIDYEVTAYELVATAVAGTTGEEKGVIDTYFIVPAKLTDGITQENVHNGTYYVYATYYGSKVIKAVVKFTVEGASEITLSPKSATVGSEIKITGVSFGNQESLTVKYDGSELPIKSGDSITKSNGSFQCVIAVPLSTAGVHSITVTGTKTKSPAADEFIVLPKIILSPQTGAAGDLVKVSGNGFGSRLPLNVFFGDFRASSGRITDRNGSFEITFEVLPAGTGIHSVEVLDANGNSSKETFTIVAKSVSISPISGYAGTEVTVNGIGFAANKLIMIKFANVQVRTTATDTTGKFSDKFIVPRHSGGNYNVSVTDGVNTLSSTFTITASISLSQTVGNIGADLTVTGNGFSGAITIRYDNMVVATTATDANGMFVSTFKVPTSSYGNHIITASGPMNTIQADFNVESTSPPVPALMLPVPDSKEKSQVSFHWESVTDPSGVFYRMQVASNSNFTDILLDKQNLTIPEYTMSKTERLPSTSRASPYYWRVKAIDKAANESAWSQPRSFYVSSFPNWAKYTLIVIGSLLVALGIFWLGMRTARIRQSTE